MLLKVWVSFFALLIQVQLAGAEMDPDKVRDLLEKIQGDQAWGEAVFANGQVRSFRVGEVLQDSVEVIEVIGALQERRGAYALGEFRSLRELGKHRIQPRRAAYQEKKSGLVAFLLEAAVPGAGYFYIGENKQGLALLGLAAAAVGTAVATGESTAAGWVPFSVWIKISSLTNLRDQVRAINQSSLRSRVELGILEGRQTPVPALRLNMSF